MLPEKFSKICENHILNSEVDNIFCLMKKLLSLLLLFGLFACEEKDCCVVIDTDVQLRYVNGEGTDLLNPDNESAFLHENIKIYVDKEGEKKLAINANSDHPNYYQLFEQKGTYVLKVFPTDELVNNEAISYIALSDSVMDTLRLAIKRSDHSTVVEKVWYNGVLQYDLATGASKREFTIVK